MTTILRRAGSLHGDFVDEAMTVEGIASTFSAVWRRDAKGPYVERLDPAGLDLDASNREGRIGIPIPLLDGHQQGSARAVIGAVTNLRIETVEGKPKLLSSLRFSMADDVQPIIQRVREKTLTGLSIGYQVTQWEDSREGPNRIRTAKRWAIHEVSLVAIPADPNSRIRKKEAAAMATEDENTHDNDNRAETRTAIRQIARAANLSAEWADEQIDAEVTVIEARAAAFEAMQARSQQQPRIRIVTSGEDPAVIRRRREDALFARISGTAPEEHAREFVGDTLRDHARSLLEANGISTRGMTADAIFARAHTISDFSNLLSATGNRMLQASYEAAQSPLKRLARQATIADFRAKSTLKLGEIGTLKKVSESGEIKHTTRGEAAESYRLDTYASIFGLSRQALINDDLGAFSDWGRAAGRAAAETEASLLVDMLKSNPTMGEDGKRLFSTEHSNLNVTALDSAAILEDLSAARLALRHAKGLDGKTPINAVPKFLLVPAELETEAEQWLARIYPATTTTSNPFESKLEILVEPRLTDDDSFYIFADPASLPVLEYAYLAGAPGPQLSSRDGWDTLGTEYRVLLDFGCGAVDWRGAWAKVPA